MIQEFSGLACPAAFLPGKTLGSKFRQVLLNSLKADDVTTFEVIVLFLAGQVESGSPVNLRVLFGDRSGTDFALSSTRDE